MEAIVEVFSNMQEDINKERKVIMKQWAKREEQIERVMCAPLIESTRKQLEQQLAQKVSDIAQCENFEE